MGIHPNAILLLTLTPQALARKTMADIFAETNTESNDQVKIGGIDYHQKIMETDYDEGMQLSANEGDLLFFDLVTYGYGESVSWETLESQKRSLEEWARGICERHHCTYKISVTANYW